MNDDTATNLPDIEQQNADVDQGVAATNVFDTGSAQTDDGQPEDGQDQSQEDDTEEVEHDGKKYRVAKELKPALMMQADYTRKTQELAELRRAAEAERTQYSRANAQHIQAIATVQALDQQLQQFQQVDWQRLSDEDPVQAQKLWMQFSQLKDGRQQLVGQVQQMEQQRAFESQQETAKRIEEGNAVLKRDIPNWGPEVGKQIKEFAAKEYGFQPKELQHINDPRVVKVLHAAMVGAKLMKHKTAPEQDKPEPQEKPVTRITANKGTATKDPGKMSDREFAEWRRRQIAQRH